MKVSIIIPVFNAAPFLDKSIQSALNQKQTGEILLIDDRSTDDSLEICKRWELLDSRVKVFVNVGTKGAGAARNVGLKNATCEYIAFLDADDYYLEGRFDEDERVFVRNFFIDGLAAPVIIESTENKTINSTSSGYFINGQIFKSKLHNSIIDLKSFLYKDIFLIQGIILNRSKLIESKINFDEFLKQTQDTDFIIELLRKFRIYSVSHQSPLVVYNLHQNNTTKNFSDAIFYKRQLFRKQFLRSLFLFENPMIVKYFFIRYLEYDYRLIIHKSYIFKKLIKIIILPIILLRLPIKTSLQKKTIL